MQKIEWLQFIVHISFGRHPWSREFHEGTALLRKIEEWLRDHHIAYAMFDAWGFPKFPAGHVPVTFRSTEAEKAMAYRVFCNQIGLGNTMMMMRIVNMPEPRLTPPPAEVAYF
jgi:hypothetical protein